MRIKSLTYCCLDVGLLPPVVAFSFWIFAKQSFHRFLSTLTPPLNHLGLGLVDTFSGNVPGLSIYSFLSLFPIRQLHFQSYFIFYHTLFHKTVIEFQVIPISIASWTHLRRHWLLCFLVSTGCFYITRTI